MLRGLWNWNQVEWSWKVPPRSYELRVSRIPGSLQRRFDSLPLRAVTLGAVGREQSDEKRENIYVFQCGTAGRSTVVAMKRGLWENLRPLLACRDLGFQDESILSIDRGGLSTQLHGRPVGRETRVACPSSRKEQKEKNKEIRAAPGSESTIQSLGIVHCPPHRPDRRAGGRIQRESYQYIRDAQREKIHHGGPREELSCLKNVLTMSD